MENQGPSVPVAEVSKPIEPKPNFDPSKLQVIDSDVVAKANEAAQAPASTGLGAQSIEESKNTGQPVAANAKVDTTASFPHGVMLPKPAEAAQKSWWQFWKK